MFKRKFIGINHVEKLFIGINHVPVKI